MAPDRNPAMEPFEALVGTWTTEAKHAAMDETVNGSTTYEWLEGGHYLIQRSNAEHPLFPTGIFIFGAPEDGEGLKAEYFDSRGVRRTYDVTFEDGVLRIWRDEPGFAQRFSATVSGEEFVGTFELAREPGEWRHDMTVIYRRVT
jgi:hypothetical protein